MDAETALEYVQCNTTADANENLLAGRCDVIFTAKPSKAQQDKAAGAGTPYTMVPVAKEAFVVFVRSDSPVNNLTSEQVRGIYSGDITNWIQVGGPFEPIVAYQRSEGSGSQTVMEEMVMRGEPMMPAMIEMRSGGMGGGVDDVTNYNNVDGAIGYSFRYYLQEMNSSVDTKMLSIDGVAPTLENIKSGRYPFTVQAYAVTAGSFNPSTQLLVDWLTSDEGQDFVEQCGYVRCYE
jgi:phosphate transport system substrate-binding protein